MSTSLLLPCSPPPHKPLNGDRVAPLISLGSFNSYTTCPAPPKAPLLKGRRSSQPQQPLFQDKFSFRDGSPAKQVLLPLDSPPTIPFAPRHLRLEGFSRDAPPPLPRRTFLPSACVASASPEATSPLNSSSPAAPLFAQHCHPATIPPLPPPVSHPLVKSNSALIMPSLITLLRPDQPLAALPRDPSVVSLKEDTTPPSPLIRKCHTMVSLSAQSGGGASVPTTRLVKERKSRLSFLRRLSSSRSAIFSSASPPPSVTASTLRHSPSGSPGLRHCRRPSVEMWSHVEHPSEGGAGYTSDEDKVPCASGGRCSRCASTTSLSSCRRPTDAEAVFCKLCLSDVSAAETYQLLQCQCRFCTYCMCMYTTLKIREGAPRVECPDSNCDCRGNLSLDEVETLVGKELLNLHLRFRRDREIEGDPMKTWCPRPGCDTVVALSASKLEGRPQRGCCPSCKSLFCATCASPWHSTKPCHRVVGQVPLNDSIKRCPRCKVPIERDAGCAQMQCKKCKHVFCWYCLASLEDDFFLRHYDKGPCKNKLGHSRASVLFHRAQVVIIFAGFGLLLVIASPLLLFVGPCLLCRSCRPCHASGDSGSGSDSSSTGSRSDAEDGGPANL